MDELGVRHRTGCSRLPGTLRTMPCRRASPGRRYPQLNRRAVAPAADKGTVHDGSRSRERPTSRIVTGGLLRSPDRRANRPLAQTCERRGLKHDKTIHHCPGRDRRRLDCERRGDHGRGDDLVALTGDRTLLTIDERPPGGQTAGQRLGPQGPLLGIDFRPADGQLYGLLANGNVVTINPRNGEATLKSRLDPPLFLPRASAPASTSIPPSTGCASFSATGSQPCRQRRRRVVADRHRAELRAEPVRAPTIPLPVPRSSPRPTPTASPARPATRARFCSTSMIAPTPSTRSIPGERAP